MLTPGASRKQGRRQKMTNHPNRKQSSTDIRYYDAAAGYVTIEGTLIRSGAGYNSGPEYGVLYCLADGRWLGGVRHTDRGDLMTEVRYAATRRAAEPRRWR